MRPNILGMAGYTPGEQINSPHVVKLNTNENPYPPSPRVFDAVRGSLTADALRKYPQPLGDTFRQAAGSALGVSPDSILIGNGSDDLLTVLTRSFVPEGGVLCSPTPTYYLYKTLAELQGAKYVTVPFEPDWTLPTPWPVTAAHLTILANPNSPSGTALRPEQVEKFAAQVNGPLVIDEAYADFCEWNCLSLVGRVPNLIVTRTMSKYQGLAGIRFGFAVASPEIIRQLVKVKDSYNCDVLSLAAATAAIADAAYYAGVRAKVIATRGRMAVELTEMGFTVTPSRANFVWCRRDDRPVKPIYDALRAKNILVRHISYPAYGDGLRMSVGTTAEVETLLGALRSILAG